MLGALSACGGGNGASGTGNTSLTTLSDVAPMFPTNGANWNDYVVGADWSTASDVACNATSDTACINGGEAMVVNATGKADCTGLTASDSLNAFNWVCDNNGGNPRFVSTGFAHGKSLSDLIDFVTPAFQAMSVTISAGGKAWGKTAATVWWGNTFTVQNTGGSLTGAGVIYLVTADPAASYTLAANKEALVIQPGVTMTGPKTNTNVVSSATGSSFLWVEGKLDVTGDYIGIRFGQTNFSTLRSVTVENASNTCIQITSSASYNRLAQIVVNHCQTYGLLVDSSASHNDFRNIVATNSAVVGVAVSSSQDNRFSEVRSANNGKYGFSSTNNTRILVSNANISNNGGQGMYVSNDNNDILSGITLSGSITAGMYMYATHSGVVAAITAANNTSGVVFNGAADENVLSNALIVNNTFSGFVVNPASNGTVANIASVSNNQSGIALVNATTFYFTGLLELGDNSLSNCAITGGTNPGLVDSSCAPQGSSDFGTAVTGISLADSVVGKASADSTNTDGAGATAAFPSNPVTFDWAHFDNAYRSWGIDGSAFPNYDQQAQWTTGTGRIWDWSASTGDTGNGGNPAIRGVLAVPTGNNTLTHVWAGTPATADDPGCDAMMPGSTYNGSGCETTFLRNAVEISDDGIGNDNTLCESGEICLYTPNLGSYQGHGSLVSAGSFTDGAITGVTLMEYSSNGR